MPNPIGRALINRRAGQETLTWANPDLQAPENFTLTSPAFEHGSPIPERFRGHIFGDNISPELGWTKPPANAVELVLVAEEPDVPGKTAGTHVFVAGIAPSLTGIPEGGLAFPSPLGLHHGDGRLGRRKWGGPMPIPSHGPHYYVFQLFALDAKLELPERFKLADMVAAMTGHVIGRARLDGTFEIP